MLVLTGAGDKAFCAGADLKAIETLDPDAPGGPLGFTRLFSPKPTIAAISGHCLAGGLELALWCDLRVATTNASFGCAERRWGVPLIDGGTQRLPRVVGTGRALDLVLTGRTIQAPEAKSMGLITRDRRAGRARHPRAPTRRGDRRAPARHDQLGPPRAARRRDAPARPKGSPWRPIWAAPSSPPRKRGRAASRKESRVLPVYGHGGRLR